ncbi:UPF0764 protein C16orf89 homolog isoform X4 [Marmota monax]|uniref:UPF0764 protein C16orf89 homolog isoform X4 n=1 Tax=Marmota monax TaxID=9995 RepID=UPI0026EF6E49|nr:UPF0764 protein C16orf89 homolog isoform X4 [Marmota monax]
MARPGLLLLLLALRPLQPSPLPRPDTTEGKVTIVGLILSALERATLFLEERLPGVNLDGVVGFRVLEEFLPSLQPGFWKLPCTWTHTNTSLVYPVLEPEDSFSEESSDACLVQLLGTGNSSQPCRIPDFCRTLMTQPNCSGYRLSHQLLFFLWARMQGCTEGLFHQSQHYISVFCANMMELTRRAEAIGYAYPTRDLFMENIMLCGISGFSDFYKLRWLEAILSWQRPWEGCFGKPGELRLRWERTCWCWGTGEVVACLCRRGLTHRQKWAWSFGSENFAGCEAYPTWSGLLRRLELHQPPQQRGFCVLGLSKERHRGPEGFVASAKSTR